MNDLIERLRLGDGTSPDHFLLLEAADALEKSVECMCGICKLGPTAAQPEQEPVEYCTAYYCAGDCGQPHNQKEMQEFLRAQPEQEPVKLVEYNCRCGRVMKFESEHGVVAPQRTWVGLTDEERIDIAYDAKRDEVVAVKLTEAKLRSKNT